MLRAVRDGTQLGCAINKKGGIRSGRFEDTSVPGMFGAGSIIQDVQLAFVAAAEGTRVALGINRAHKRRFRSTSVQSIADPAVDDKEGCTPPAKL